MERQAKIRTFFLTPAEVINGIFRKLYYSQERYYCGKKKNDLMMSSRGRLERESEIKQRAIKKAERATACIQPLQPHQTFHASAHFSRVWQSMNVINHEYNITHKL